MPVQIVQVDHQGVAWRVRAGEQADLLGGDSPNWFALQEEPRAVRVKAGSRRTIWKVEWNGRVVFAKVAEPPQSSTRNRLKEWLVGTAVKREWRACLAAESRSVPVVRALALGVRNGDQGGTVLLSEGLTDATPLVDVWERRVASKSGRGRRSAAGDMIDVTARLLAESHERGFVHQDAHPSNILVTSTPGAEMRAVFVDVHSARITKSPASYRDTLRALAHFDQYFQRRASRCERLRFLRAYRNRRPALDTGGPSERRLLADLAEAKLSHAAGLARQRDRRLGRNGKYFGTLELGDGWRATVVRELERRHLFPEPSVPDRTDDQWRAILQPVIARANDPSLPEAKSGEEQMDFEFEHVGGLAARLGATIGRSRHRQRFEQCHRLRHRDIPAPLILACVEHRTGGLIDQTILGRVGAAT